MNESKKILALAIVIGILFVPLAIAYSPKPDIDKVKDKHERDILAIKGVSGVYADKDSNAIVVFIENDAIAGKVPKEIEGIKVNAVITGKIRAFKMATPDLLQPLKIYSRTGVDSPIFGGISLGSASIPCSSGTLGIVTRNNPPYILSAAHVLALDDSVNFVTIGNPTWQPGGADTSCGTFTYNAVSKLANYMPIVFMDNSNSVNNYADAAVATVNNGIGNLTDNELNKYNNGFYTVSGTTNVNRGNIVRKSGRTTGVTTGMVLTNSATVTVWYSDTIWAVFKDQIVVYSNSFSSAGDSGSVVDKNGKWVGLLFAGGGPYTIISKASYINAPPAGTGSSNTGGLGVII